MKVRGAPYGFRGVRVGEAKHPGPSRKRKTRVFRMQSESDSDHPLTVAVRSSVLSSGAECDDDHRRTESLLAEHPRIGQEVLPTVSRETQGTSTRPRRRLVLVSAHNASNCESDSGRSGASEADADKSDPESEEEVLVEPVNVNMRARAVTSGFESLDVVDLTDVFQFKASIMQSVPKFLHATGLH